MRHTVKHVSLLVLLSLILALSLSVCVFAEGESGEGGDEPAPDYSTLTLGEDGKYRNSQNIVFDLQTDGTNTAYVGTGDVSDDNNSEYEGDNNGNVIIPATVSYDGQTYSVTKISLSAFSGNTLVNSITLGKNIRNIDYAYWDDYANGGLAVGAPFIGCTSLKEFIVAEGNTNYCAIDGVLFDKTQRHLICVPGGKTANRYTVASSVAYIECCAFSSCVNIPSVTVSAKSDASLVIKDMAFYKADGIKEITITGGVYAIGDHAFRECESLKKLSVKTSDSSSTAIGNYTVYGCPALETATLSGGINKIGNCAFTGCTALITATISGSVKSIGYYVFAKCENLKTAYICGGVEALGVGPLFGCSSVQTLTLPFLGTTPTAGGYLGSAFYNNVISKPYEGDSEDTRDKIENKYNVTIPDTLREVTILGGTLFDNAFYTCHNVESITLGSSFTELPIGCFSGCTALSRIDLGLSETTGGKEHAEAGIVKLLPHIKKLNHFVFFNCPLIARFDVDEENAAYASDYFGALYNKDFTELICYPPASPCQFYCVKGSTRAIHGRAFSKYCTNLITVNIPNSDTELGVEGNYKNVFNSGLTALTICVHKDSAALKSQLSITEPRVWIIENVTPTKLSLQYIGDTHAFEAGSEPEFENLQIVAQITGEINILLDPLDYTASYSSELSKAGLKTVTLTYSQPDAQGKPMTISFKAYFFDKREGWRIIEFPLRSSLSDTLAAIKKPMLYSAIYEKGTGVFKYLCPGAVIDNAEQWKSLHYAVYVPAAVAKLVDTETGAVDTKDTVKTFLLDGFVPLCEADEGTLLPLFEKLVKE